MAYLLFTGYAVSKCVVNNPCKNGGKCVESKGQILSCLCKAGFRGIYCGKISLSTAQNLLEMFVCCSISVTVDLVKGVLLRVLKLAVTRSLIRIVKLHFVFV